MPRYFFRIRDNVAFQDVEGKELPNLRKAYDEAIDTMSSILRQNLGSLSDGQPCRMDVTDGQGQLHFSLEFALRQMRPRLPQ